MGLTESPLYRRCGAQKETSAHVLSTYEPLATLRHHYLGSYSLDPKDVSNLTLESSWVLIKGTEIHNLDFRGTKDISSECEALSRDGYLAITYQLVKLLPPKKAAKNRVESRYMKCGIFGIVTSWRVVWMYCGWCFDSLSYCHRQGSRK